MKHLFLLLTLTISLAVHSQNREQGPWWPHALWGPDDQAGASNWITPEKIVTASKWIKTGKTYELGHIYEKEMPVPDNRTFELFIPSFPTYGPIGEERTVFLDELLITQIGQVGTQFDGLGHPGKMVDMEDGTTTEVFYNGFTGEEVRGPFGLQNLGIEHVKPIITTGIMIDLPASMSMDALDEKHEVSLAEVRNALARQGLTETDIKPGDAILFNFGWWRTWEEEYAIDENRHPLLSMEVIQWIIDRQPAMVGSDAMLDGGGQYRAHRELTMKNGIFNLEWLNFEELSADKAYQFMFIFTPLRIKGATGSIGRPLAIK
jgi:kynurenine formamidase